MGQNHQNVIKSVILVVLASYLDRGPKRRVSPFKGGGVSPPMGRCTLPTRGAVCLAPGPNNTPKTSQNADFITKSTKMSQNADFITNGGFTPKGTAVPPRVHGCTTKGCTAVPPMGPNTPKGGFYHQWDQNTPKGGFYHKGVYTVLPTGVYTVLPQGCTLFYPRVCQSHGCVNPTGDSHG